MTVPDPADEARRLYPTKLRRAEVLALCALFGHSPSVARSFIEGPTAPVKGRAYGSTERRVRGVWQLTRRRHYYDRDDVIAACR